MLRWSWRTLFSQFLILFIHFFKIWFVYKQMYKTFIRKTDLWSALWNTVPKRTYSPTLCVVLYFCHCVTFSFWSLQEPFRVTSDKPDSFQWIKSPLRMTYFLCSFCTLNFAYVVYHNWESFLAQQYWLSRSLIL